MIERNWLKLSEGFGEKKKEENKFVIRYKFFFNFDCACYRCLLLWWKFIGEKIKTPTRCLNEIVFNHSFKIKL
jgi:hypothetical protein